MTTEQAVAPIAEPEGNVADPLELVTPEVTTPVEDAAEAAAEAPVEAAPPPKSIADLSDEELENEPRVRERIRRTEQSIRDRAVAEEQRRADERLQQYMARGEYAEELASAYSLDQATGTVSADRRKLGDVVGRLQAALTTQTSGQAYAALNALLPFETLPAEARERIRLAGNGWMQSYIDAIADHRATEREPEKRKVWQAEYVKEQSARATAAERKAASDARQSAGPTSGITGGPPTSFASRREIDRAHMDGALTTAQVKEWRDSGRYAALPF